MVQNFYDYKISFLPLAIFDLERDYRITSNLHSKKAKCQKAHFNSGLQYHNEAWNYQPLVSVYSGLPMATFSNHIGVL